MALLSNVPTLSYIRWQNLLIVYKDEVYQIYNNHTNRPFIYFDAINSPNELIMSNKKLEERDGLFYIIFNDNGKYIIVPQTEIEINFSENSNNSVDAVSSKILGFKEQLDEQSKKVTTIETDVDGIKTTVGQIEENIAKSESTMSSLEQRADKIDAEVKKITIDFSDDVAIRELRENTTMAILSIQSTLGLFSSDMNTYMKDNRLSSDETDEINAYKEILNNELTLMNLQVNNVIDLLEDKGDVEKVTRLNTAKEKLNTAINNLYTNIDTCSVDNIFTNSEIATIISYFGKANVAINELKNLIDECIYLSLGGRLVEEIGKITVKQDQIQLSVSKNENSINDTITDINNVDKKWAEIILDPESGIQSQVGNIQKQINDNGGIIERLNTAEQKITSDAIINTVSSTFYSKEEVENRLDDIDVGLVVKSVDVMYYLSTSNKTLEGGTWVTEAPSSLENGKYIWSKTVTTYTDESKSETKPICIAGGKDGKGIVTVVDYYKVHASNTGVTNATSGFSTNVPQMDTTNKYLWSYELITYTDNSTTKTSARVIGVYGDKGTDGKGISSIVEYYAVNNSSTTAPTSFKTTISTVSTTNRFLWNYEEINFTDGSKKTTDKRIIGVYGETGETGKGIKSIVEEYYLSTSKTSQTGGSWVNSPPTWVKGKYMWTRSKITYSDDSTVYTTPICDSTWEAVDDIEIGGRNLIRKSNISKNASQVTYDNNTNTWTIVAVAGEGGTWGSGLYLLGKNIVIPYGKTYTLSFEIKVPRSCSWNIDVNNYPVSGSAWSGNDNDNMSMRKTSSKSLVSGQWIKCWSQFTNTDTNNTNKVDIYDNSNFGVVMQNETSNMTYYIRNVKGEIGNVASDWSPAPEDIQEQIDNNKEMIETTKTTVATHSTSLNSITSRVATTESNITTINGKITNVENRVASAEQKITSDAIINTVSSVYSTKTETSAVQQTADKINWLIKSGTSSSNMQLTSNALNIISANINLSGYVTFSDLSGSGKTTINGSNITSGTIRGIEIISSVNDNTNRVSMVSDGHNYYSPTKLAGKIAFDSKGEGTESSAKDRFLIQSLNNYVLKLLSTGDMSITSYDVIYFEANKLQTNCNLDLTGKKLDCGNIYCSNNITCTSVTATSGISASSVTATGTLQGASLKVTGSVTGGSASLGGINGTSLNITGTSWLSTVSCGQIQPTSIACTGTINTSGSLQGHTCAIGNNMSVDNNAWIKYLYVNGTQVTSDETLKTDIKYVNIDEQTISGDSGLMSPNVNITTSDMHEFIETLPMVSYRLIDDVEKGKDETYYGFLAQEILYSKVGSELVTIPTIEEQELVGNKLRYSETKYISFIAGALQEEIKQRKEEINILNNTIINLEEKIKDLEDKLNK